MSTLLLLLTFHLVRIMTASAAGRNRWLVSSIVLRRERETRSITMQTGVCRRVSENFSSFFSDFSREEMADRYRGRDNAVYVRTGVDRRAVVNRSDGNWKFISLIIFFGVARLWVSLVILNRTIQLPMGFLLTYCFSINQVTAQGGWENKDAASVYTADNKP